MNVKQQVYEGYLITTKYHEEFLDTKKYKITPELLYETTVSETVPGFDIDAYIDLCEPVEHLTRWCKTYEQAIENHEDMLEEVEYLIENEIFSHYKLKDRIHYAIYPDEKGAFQVWQVYSKQEKDSDVWPVQIIRVKGEADDDIETTLEIVNMLNKRQKEAGAV